MTKRTHRPRSRPRNPQPQPAICPVPACSRFGILGLQSRRLAASGLNARQSPLSLTSSKGRDRALHTSDLQGSVALKGGACRMNVVVLGLDGATWDILRPA